MNSRFRESWEFSKWLYGRFTEYLFLGTSFSDNYMKWIIHTEMEDHIRTIRLYGHPALIGLDAPKDLDSQDKQDIGLFCEIIDSDMDQIRQDYEPMNYSAFPFYSHCSWELNKEFRRKHDEISSIVRS